MSKTEEMVDKLNSLRNDVRDYESFLMHMNYSKSYIRKQKTIIFWSWMGEVQLPHTLHTELREFVQQKLTTANNQINEIQAKLTALDQPRSEV
jgi:uncharacterized membrane protein (DUF106 family)